jgi:membrane-bound inhibitor of C-type lysozyme
MCASHFFSGINWPELVIGALIGFVLGLLPSLWSVYLTARDVKRAYQGTWSRELIEEHHAPVNPQGCDGKKIRIKYKNGRVVHAQVHYDDRYRGMTTAYLEVASGERSASGPYTYDRKGDFCFGNAGWYRCHLVSDGRMFVYYNGDKPIKDVSGYEVWVRENMDAPDMTVPPREK